MKPILVDVHDETSHECLHDPLDYTLWSLRPMSQKLISNSVARMKIRINSSMRLGDTFWTCASNKSAKENVSQPHHKESAMKLSYQIRAARLLNSHLQRSSQSISNTGSLHGGFHPRYTIVWRWRRIQWDTARGPSVTPASLLIGPRRECIGCMRCMLSLG